jgi:hypothetical protein
MVEMPVLFLEGWQARLAAQKAFARLGAGLRDRSQLCELVCGGLLVGETVA